MKQSRPAAAVPAPGPSAGTTYVLLLEHVGRLRAALLADRSGSRSLVEVRRSHADLQRSLADAVRQAFAADALGTAPPPGINCWAAEGLARSHERELALIAASDVPGLAVPITSPVPGWGQP